MGNLGFLKKKYGKRQSIEAISAQKRFKKEIEMVHPLPLKQKQMPLASLFKKSSPKRFNWTATLNRPIQHASPQKAINGTGLFKEALSTRPVINAVSSPKITHVSGLFTDVSTPTLAPILNESQYNTPDTLLREFDDINPLLAAPLLTISDESWELNGSEILDYYDFLENSETSTPSQSIIKNDLLQPVSPIYSEKSFFQDEQSFICQEAYGNDMDSVKRLSKANDLPSVKSTPKKERQVPLSPPRTPASRVKKTVIDVSGI